MTLEPAAAVAMQRMTDVPLIAHVIHRLAVGGLENGLVNLINHIPADRYRHAVICLTDYDDFRARIARPDVEVYALHKAPGIRPGLYTALYRLFKRLRPDIVHTRNLATVEAQLPAWLAGVPIRVHGEHGRDMHDVDNTRSRYRLLRRVLSPLVHEFIVVSQDLEQYLIRAVGVAPDKITRIINGVDSERFAPRAHEQRDAVLPSGFATPQALLIGSVGRMETVKDPLNLARAFVYLHAQRPDLAPRLRLVMIGDGPLLADVRACLHQAGLAQQVWLPGARDDIAGLLPALDLFVLPSRAEGISNTVLEAMACALPVIATAVGGNVELVEAEVTGLLVPRADPQVLAQAMVRYCDDTKLRQAHGAAARARIERDFSLARMVQSYVALYDRLLVEQNRNRGRAASM